MRPVVAAVWLATLLAAGGVCLHEFAAAGQWSAVLVTIAALTASVGLLETHSRREDQ